MEDIHQAPEDFISTMPDNVITNILDRLPLQDAVRTGILASNWRFKWTMLSQLIFNNNFFIYLSKTKSENSHVRVVISRLLLHLHGAITKCELSIGFASADVDIKEEDISHWILFLSKKGITCLTIELFHSRLWKLPTHLFSCLELKHLELSKCLLHSPASFHGFPNLLSLELSSVQFENTELGEFITRCPLLEILKLFWLSKVKLAEIAKLENLKILYLEMVELDTRNLTDREVTEGFNKRFSIAFPCIKALKLLGIRLDNGHGRFELRIFA